MTLAELARSQDFDSVNELVELSGLSKRTLSNWAKSRTRQDALSNIVAGAWMKKHGLVKLHSDVYPPGDNWNKVKATSGE